MSRTARAKQAAVETPPAPDLERCERRIDYVFRDKNLLFAALTHAALAQSSPVKIGFAGPLTGPSASYGKDPKFAAFFRSMEAYRTAFSDGDTTMVLSPDADFFKYFRKGPDAR